VSGNQLIKKEKAMEERPTGFLRPDVRDDDQANLHHE